MSTTIESLELEIQSSSSSAEKGIDALSASLSRLKSALKGGVGLRGVSNQLNALNSALASMDSNGSGKIDRLASSLSKLSSMGNVKLSSSIGNQIRNIGSAAATLDGIDLSGIDRLGASLRGLNSLTKATGLSSALNQLKRIPEITKAMDSKVIADFATRIRQLSDALQPLTTQINTVGGAFSKLPVQVRRVISSTQALDKANRSTAQGYINLWAKVIVAYNALRMGGRMVASWIHESNSYIENLNLFTASMGEYAGEAKKYAEQVGEVMGIDPGEFMRNQGVFMTITEGFGVASDRAHIMSKNLTQLGYDLSSFFNISFSDSMQKLTSGISGELEPLRRLGYDLSEARLKAVALSLGIDKSFNSMTQAEKAQLRYYTIMKQVTVAQGDMARTLNAPANQLRILQAQVTQCARAFGNIFIPILNAVLPYAIALAKVIRLVANVIGSLFGFSLPEIDYSGIGKGAGVVGDLAGNAENASSGLGKAAKKAKELKNALLGIDELNIISPMENATGDTGGAGGAGGGVGGGAGLDFELPEYDFLNGAVSKTVDDIVKKMKEWLGLTEPINSWADFFNTRLGAILKGVIAIGTGLAAWKIAKGVSKFIDSLSNLNFGGAGKLLGLISFADNLHWIGEYFQDIMENGASFRNIGGFLGEIAAGIGTGLALLGNINTGAALIGLGGLAQVIGAIKDIFGNGLNFDNAIAAVRGLSKFLLALGLVTQNAQLIGSGLALQGLTTVTDAIRGAIDETGKIDWSKVDLGAVVRGALEFAGGIMSFFGAFDKLKGLFATGKAIETTTTIETAMTTMDTTNQTIGASGGKMTSLVKNLGLGVAILGEVAAGAIIFAGAIVVIGIELSKVAEAWKPVIENAGTVAIAIGVGTGLLVGIGAATYALGTAGGTVALNVGIGIAVLAELGVATGLFIAEIWGVGKGLDEIGKAWQPVLDNGKTIAIGIGIGTGLLVGVGAAAAGLGAATVATAGALPAAIGLGTALLVELAVAVVAFIESLVKVANELSGRLAPALSRLNILLPKLTTDMSSFVNFMEGFAWQVVRYTKSSGISGISATIDTIVKWFTRDPLDKLAKDVEKIGNQTKSLNEKLRVANPELKTAIGLMNDYTNFIDELGKIAAKNGTVKLSEGLKVNLKEVGSNIVTGFNEGIQSKYSSLAQTVKNWGKNIEKWFTNRSHGGVNKEAYATYAGDIINGFNAKISASSGNSKASIMYWATGIKDSFTRSGINSVTFSKYANDIINGFNQGISSGARVANNGINTWANNTKRYFTNIVSFWAFRSIGNDVVRGFNQGVSDLYYSTRRYMREWANSAAAAFKQALDSHSPSKVFMKIGSDTVLGYNNGIEDMGGTTKTVVDSWAKSFTSVDPVMSFAVDTSALKYYNSESFAKEVSTDFTSSKSYSVSGFKESMVEFYHEFMEPTMVQMAEDVRRQADKDEQTIVQVGNKVISDAVVTQQKANGFVFAK